MFPSRPPIVALVLVAALGGACAPPPSTTPPPEECADGGSACLPPLESQCAEGFIALPAGRGCMPLLPSSECPPGTMPRIGSEACEPVGVTSCAEGFLPDESGWGCRALLPVQACAGATRDGLGAAGCLPLGDCAAPFPPPGTTHLVDAALPDAGLDGTHFRAISDALAAAPAGAVIAIASGDYPGALAVTRPVTLVGRCAGEVRIRGSGDGKLGLLVQGARDVAVRGVRFEGHTGGVAVSGGSLTLEEVLLEANVLVGLLVTEPGAQARLVRSVIRGTVPTAAGDRATHGALAQKGARLEVEESALVASSFSNLSVSGDGSFGRVSRSVLRDGRAQETGPYAGKTGFGAYANEGGALELVESAVLDNVSDGVFASKVSPQTGAPSTATVSRCVVSGTRANLTDGFGRGVEATAGARASVADSTVSESFDYNLLAVQGGALIVERTTVTGPPDSEEPLVMRIGLLAGSDAVVEVRSSAIVRSGAIGLGTELGGRARVERSLVLGTRGGTVPAYGTAMTYGHGVFANGGPLELLDVSLLRNRVVSLLVNDGTRVVGEGVLIADTEPDRWGLLGRGADVQDGARLELGRSAILRSRELGLLVDYGGSEAVLTDSVVASTAADARGLHGDGVMAIEGRVSLTRTTVRESEGIGVAAAQAGGFLSGCTLSSNAVGIHVQDGSALREAEQPSGAPLEVVLTPDTRFVENDSRLGSGVVPLPSQLALP